jgi:glyoxylase-like metal-dependent hydrolase (beta-lactamase superfamily II)
MKITDNIYSLDFATHSHAFLINENGRFTMIDTGLKTNINKIIMELHSFAIGEEDIKNILLTHGDVDHIGNLKNLQKRLNCSIYADINEIPYLAKKKRYSLRKWLFKVILHIPKFEQIKPLPKKQIGDIEIIKTPGHTPGHVCYKYQDYMFVGDLINTRGGKIQQMSEKFTMDQPQSLQSIKAIDMSNIKYICPAHGDIINAHPQ